MFTTPKSLIINYVNRRFLNIVKPNVSLRYGRNDHFFNSNGGSSKKVLENNSRLTNGNGIKVGISSPGCYHRTFLNCQNQLLHVSWRSFRTSPCRSAIPPVVVLLLSRVAKFGAMLTGRLFRTWWKKLPAEQRMKLLGRMSQYRNAIGGMVGLLGFGAFVFYETHQMETPITHRRRFVAFNDKQFDEIAKHELEVLLEMHKGSILPANLANPDYKRVVHIAQRLLNANMDLPQLENKEWTVTVVDDPAMVNAFVLPCGSIFVFSGMLNFCDTDDQLGVILGHEMAHAVMGHGAEQASFLAMMDLLMLLPLAVLWAVAPLDVTAAIIQWIIGHVTDVLINLPYSRALETEADEVGLLLAAKACFDVREASLLWNQMAIMAKEEGQIQIDWMSTHPSHEERVSHIEEHLPNAISIREHSKCPRLPVLNPGKRLEDFKRKLKRNNSFHSRDELVIPLKPIRVT